jgi:hypothetical protein
MGAHCPAGWIRRAGCGGADGLESGGGLAVRALALDAGYSAEF